MSRLRLAAGLAVACWVAQGCTDGTTPDCSDAQCLVVSVVEAGGDAAPPDGDGQVVDDAGQDAAESSVASEAGADSAGLDAGSPSDAGGG